MELAGGAAEELPPSIAAVLRVPKSPLKGPAPAADDADDAPLSEPEAIRRGLASLISQAGDGISIQIPFRSNQPTLYYTSRECCPEAAEYTADNLLKSGVPLWYALHLSRKIAREMYPPLPLPPEEGEEGTGGGGEEEEDLSPPASPVRNNIAKRAHALLATYVEEILQQSDEELLAAKPKDTFPLSLYTARNLRRKMEDRHIAIPRLGLVEPDAGDAADDAVYAVFDGHGGAEVAGYLATHFLDHLVRSPSYAHSVPDAMREAFASCDKAINKRAAKTYYRCPCPPRWPGLACVFDER